MEIIIALGFGLGMLTCAMLSQLALRLAIAAALFLWNQAQQSRK